LTHMHTDHLNGLYKSGTFYPVLGWNYGKIYCSQLSAKMLLSDLPYLRPYV